MFCVNVYGNVCRKIVILLSTFNLYKAYFFWDFTFVNGIITTWDSSSDFYDVECLKHWIKLIWFLTSQAELCSGNWRWDDKLCTFNIKCLGD